MATIKGLHAHNFSSGTEEIIAVWKTATMHRNGSSWFRGPGVQLTNNTDAWMSSFLDEVFLTNGVDNNWNYDGSLWSQTNNVLGSPIGKFNAPHSTRMFLYNIKINGVSYPSRVWFSDLPGETITWGLAYGSDLVQTADSNTVTSVTGQFKSRNIKVGDPFFITSGTNQGRYVVQALGDTDGDNLDTTIQLTESLENTTTGSSFWVGSNWFDVGTDDGDVGNGIGITSNEIFFFKKNSLYRYNVTGKELRRVKIAYGTTSPRSIVSDGGYCYWYHPSGIYRTTGTQEELVSNPIEDAINGVTDHTAVVGWVNQVDGTINMYLGDITLRDGETITKCVASLDQNSDSWSLRSYDKTVKVATTWLKSSVPEVYVGDDSNGVHHFDYGNTFNGEHIPFIMDTQAFFPVGPESVVEFDRLRAFIENGPDIQILFKLYYRPLGDEQNWIIDDDWTPLKGSQVGEMSEWVFPTDSRASGVKFRLIESSGDESFLIEKMVLYYSNPASY